MEDVQTYSDTPQFSKFYQQNYENMSEGKSPKRFVVYQVGDHTGWGNKLRGIYAAFLLALVTDRILLIDYPLLLETFDPPKGVEWSFSKYKHLIHKGASKLYIDPLNRLEELNALKNDDLNITFPQTFLFHVRGTAFDEAIVENPHYAEKLSKLFEHYQSRMSKVGQVMQFLLQQPNTRFLKKVNRRKVQFGLLNTSTTVAIQFRSFYDIGSPNLKYVDQFIAELKSILTSDLRYLARDEALRFFITTDDLNVTRRFSKELSEYGMAIYDDQPIVHTGNIPLINRLLNKVFQDWLKVNRNTSKTHFLIDWNLLLPRKFRYQAEQTALTDWYLLGECDILISTMTSYPSFAAARVGHQQTIFKIGYEAPYYCGLVTEEEYAIGF